MCVALPAVNEWYYSPEALKHQGKNKKKDRRKKYLFLMTSALRSTDPLPDHKELLTLLGKHAASLSIFNKHFYSSWVLCWVLWIKYNFHYQIGVWVPNTKWSHFLFVSRRGDTYLHFLFPPNLAFLFLFVCSFFSLSRHLYVNSQDNENTIMSSECLRGENSQTCFVVFFRELLSES